MTTPVEPHGRKRGLFRRLWGRLRYTGPLPKLEAGKDGRMHWVEPVGPISPKRVLTASEEQVARSVATRLGQDGVLLEDDVIPPLPDPCPGAVMLKRSEGGKLEWFEQTLEGPKKIGSADAEDGSHLKGDE